MHQPSPKKFTKLNWLYFATMVSSIGTYAFPGATIAAMTQLKFPLWQMGALMAISRAGSLVGSGVFGDFADRFSPGRVVFVTEAIATVFSILLAMTWATAQENFWPFSVVVFLRFVAISIASPSRNKVVKVLSVQSGASHFNAGVFLNVVTYGPAFIGSVFGFFAIKYLSYEWVIGFDALTFAAGGLIVYRLVGGANPEGRSADSVNKQLLFSKFKVYFGHTKPTQFDVLLTVPFMGTNVLMSKLSHGDGTRVPIFLMTFGLAALISGPLLRFAKSKATHVAAYVAMLLSFVFLRQFNDFYFLTILGLLLRNVAYWYLYNLYTGYYQEIEDTAKVSALFSARAFVSILLLGCGELIFGVIGEALNLELELAIRAAFCLLLIWLAMATKDSHEKKFSFA